MFDKFKENRTRKIGVETYIRIEDYLKVVEEKETAVKDYWKLRNKYEKELEKLKEKNNEYLELYNLDKNKIENLEKELKEKEEQIKIREEIGKNDCLTIIKLENEIKEKDEDIVKRSLYKQCEEYEKEIKDLNKRITCLELGIEEEKEELWVLHYVYLKDDVKKMVHLEPQPLDEIHELVGMDCDNWVAWSIEKEVKL